MKKQVVFVELPVFSGVLPLASGYMEAYARKDPALVAAFDFTKISLAVNTPYDALVGELLQAQGDVYAISCYVWNGGLVRRLVETLQQKRPSAHIILGGPQVMRQGERYLPRGRSQVVVCNGEGERTLASFLSALLAGQRDFSAVRNISFYRDGQLVTTEPEPRISDLSEVPSPFLEGLFETNKFTWALLETNRGCPFKCNYCFWGAAIGGKVYRYDERRVEDEIEWISRSGALYLFIADANWGMLTRDVDLSRHLVECRKRHGFPLSVYFCGSKNTPERVAEISGIFHEAGLVATQSVALQTMSVETLKQVNRDNIRMTTYTDLQAELNRRQTPSFVEMIWPLPGETLSSFQAGLAQLCELRADCFVVYPLLLMNNVELQDKRDEYGLITRPDPDPNCEAELVVATRDVSAAEYQEGSWFVYALYGLYALRGLWTLGRYLNDTGRMGYADLFRRFADHARRSPDHPWTRFCADSIRTFAQARFSNTGELMHRFLHADREAFDRLVTAFVTEQEFWDDAEAQFLFELDLVARPYVYGNTPFLPKRHRFAHLGVTVAKNGYAVTIPPRFDEVFARYVTESGGAARRGVINHRRGQLPFMPRKSLHEHYMYCQSASDKVRKLMPAWQFERELVTAV